jgi:hypothetical protein
VETKVYLTTLMNVNFNCRYGETIMVVDQIVLEQRKFENGQNKDFLDLTVASYVPFIYDIICTFSRVWILNIPYIFYPKLQPQYVDVHGK